MPVPKVGQELRKQWQNDLAVEFKKSLIDTCRANSISTIFMRGARSWSDHYGSSEGLSVVEAGEHIDALLEEYGRRVIREALQFIDYERSQRLGEKA